ncbi:unnamed protein product [Eruca vesicaria subsp. sativa]|uniref:Protein PHYTOCHROME KINASE SUBSTRATE 4 n=1 Tax=Eruca vesicaria subsp. sativa TaxID=29727 RepID=A0ABC8L9X1_ERUVS|nr:unnamed protein product [Eruca vesicaria subsp. sativa]
MAETTVTVVATKRDALDPYIKIIQSRSLDIDVSFSSYLKPDNNEQKEQEEAEISIFEARRYFNESGTTNLSGPRFSTASSAKVSSFTVGHTASSEASWNSQTGLLRNNNNNRQKSDRDGRGSSKKGHRWFFRRRTCPCSSSKSVQVQETKPRIAESITGSDRTISNRVIHHNHQRISSSDPIRLTIPSNRESRGHVSNFTFPTLTEPIKPALNPIEPVLHPIKPVLSPTSPKGVTTTDEEAASDASSDLFEIESFSTQHIARPFAPPAADSVRNSIDETVTEYGYEPSEASVTWSVTTAEPVSRMANNFSRIGLSQPSLVSDGQRLVQPLKSVSVQDDVMQKVLCNNGSSKLSVTSRAVVDNKPSFLV